MIFGLILLVSGVSAFLALRISSTTRPLQRITTNPAQYRPYTSKRANTLGQTHLNFPQLPYYSESLISDYESVQPKVMSVSPRQLSLRIGAPFDKIGDIFDQSINYASVDAFTPDLDYPFEVYRNILEKMKDMEDAGQSQIKITKWLQKYLYGMTESPSFLASQQHRALTQLLLAHFKEVLIEGVPTMRGVIVDEMVSRSKDLILKDIAKGIRGLSRSELQVAKSKPLMRKLLDSIKREYSLKIANINDAAFRSLVIKDDHEQVSFLQYRLCSVFCHALRGTSADLKLSPHVLLTTDILLFVENRCLQGLSTSGMTGDTLCPFVHAVTLTVGALVDVVGVLEVREIEETFIELSNIYTIHYH